MVSQAATQTRFRALKHETGIAGSATIVVRVIACFQPLQDCQAEYFRHLLKPVTDTETAKSLVYYQRPLSGKLCFDWMEEAWEVGRPPKLRFDWQPSLLNSFGIAPSNPRQSYPTVSSVSNQMVTMNGTFPVNSALKVPQSQVGRVNEPCNWFHCLGPSQQAISPVKSSIYGDKLAALSEGLSKEVVTPLSGSGKQKGFLVIDQSADKTTLVLCSGGGAPLQLLTSWSPQPPAGFKFNEEDIGSKRDSNYDSKHVLSNEFPENHDTDEQSEMQEDTEELNALLYSDDESEFDKEDEVTSTGHSPSSMTTKDKQYAYEENTEEEVASSAGSTKKRKIEGCYDLTSVTDTASSLMPRSTPEYDAESSCGNEGSSEEGTQEVDYSSSSINKKMRKEKIRETVGILESLIPGGKGKEAIVVLDEAIQYLKSLKLKAEAFGLNAF